MLRRKETNSLKLQSLKVKILLVDRGNNLDRSLKQRSTIIIFPSKVPSKKFFACP
jgi:hypothetical protein